MYFYFQQEAKGDELSTEKLVAYFLALPVFGVILYLSVFFLSVLYGLAAGLTLIYFFATLFFNPGGGVVFEILNSIIQEPLFFLILESPFFIALILAVVAYNINKIVVIRDGYLFLPATDVELNIISFIFLKPVWGLFYKRKVLLENIISVNLDGYGSKKLDIYPVTVVDVKKSNRLIFTSRQKRDEFRMKIAALTGQSAKGFGAFGESEG